MIWRQVKKRTARVKLHLLFLHLKFVETKKFFTILALKQPNSEKCIFAVYKYSRSFLKRTLSPKFLSDILSLWLFYEWLAPSQVLVFSKLKLHNWFQKVIHLFLSYLFFFRIRCVLNLHPNLRQYQLASPRT